MADQVEHHSSTARALAGQHNDNNSESQHVLPTPVSSHRANPQSPPWTRRSLDTPTNNRRPQSQKDRYLELAEKYYNQGWRIWAQLSPLQQAGAVAFVIISSIVGMFAMIYSERIFHALAPGAKRWREMPAGWLILWLMTFFVGFPPMIGYSTCLAIGGFVFGMKGWFVVASATIVGSTLSFLVSRTVLKGFVSRMTEKNQRFAALSLVLKHDGIKLLVMIRLCPLPYSFSNGAISTIPTVTWQNFMIATAIATPKLLLQVFVGRQLGIIAETGDKMSFGAKMVNYTTMSIGMALGAGTGYLIYSRTEARAAALQAEEAAAAQEGGRRRASGSDVESGGDDIDDADEREAVNVLRARPSDVSLHTTYGVDLERGYHDDFTDDGLDDARERDVSDPGAGETTDDENVAKRKRPI